MDANKFLPKSCVPHVESKLERAQTGGWGRGPGNNVSNVMCGVNVAHAKALTEVGAAAMKRNPGRMKERQRRALERAAPHNRPSDPVQGPVQAPKPRQMWARIPVGGTDVALRDWQTHALNRLKTKR